MSLDLGISSSVRAVSGTGAWWITAGGRSLTRLEGGDVLQWPESHLFVLNEETGHLMVDGSLGTFAHAWPSWGRAKGESLAGFLSKVGFDYFMTKAARQPWTEVDVPASIMSMRRTTLKERRAAWIERAAAREIWDDLAELDEQMMEGELLHALTSSGVLYDTFVADGGPPFVRRTVGTARRFWDEVWPTFRTQVLVPLAEERPIDRAA